MATFTLSGHDQTHLVIHLDTISVNVSVSMYATDIASASMYAADNTENTYKRVRDSVLRGSVTSET